MSQPESINSVLSLPVSSVVKDSTCNAGDLGLIPELGGSPGEGKGYPLQYSGLENFMDCSTPGIAFHEISQARILEWVAISFSQESSWPRGWTHICIEGADSLPLSYLGSPENQMEVFKDIRSWTKHFTCIITLTLHYSSVKWALWVSLFSR